MNPETLKPGDTFVIRDRGGVHLYILVAINGKAKKFVFVNITTRRDLPPSGLPTPRDPPWRVTLKKGDHDFIKRDSDVNLGDALAVNEASVPNFLSGARKRNPMTSSIATRIVGAMTISGAVPDEIKRLLR